LVVHQSRYYASDSKFSAVIILIDVDTNLVYT
jgi:hypothetical protein